MKDPTDSSTADLIPEPKRRGPKPTGTALTPAERKKQQRERDKERALLSSMSDGKPMTITGLVEAIATAARLGLPELVMLHAQQLADRIRERKTEQANHVTVADPGTSENP